MTISTAHISERTLGGSWFGRTIFAAGLTVYVAFATLVAVVYPMVAPVFLIPLGLAVLTVLPTSRTLPRNTLFAGVFVGTVLLALWPVYIHVKVSPLPILTPARVILYAVSAAWLFEMICVPHRRAQLASTIKSNSVIFGCFAVFYLAHVVSLPLAHGRAIAVPEFIRQTIIWFIPFLIAVTYCRHPKDLKRLVSALTVIASILGTIAIAEAATKTLLASILSPLIADNAEWLRIAQAEKIRDGAFRAQAVHTHPLSLGEYLAIFAPFALAQMADGKSFGNKALWFGAFLLIIVGALATNSRAALLAVLATVTLMGTFMALRFVYHPNRQAFRPIVGMIMAGALAFSPVAFVGLNSYISGSGATSASNSSQARLDQIEMALPKIAKRPLNGYGIGRSTIVLGYWGRALTLDNYFLSLALDMGILGPIIFLVIFLSIARKSHVNSRATESPYQYFYLAFAASILGFLLCRSVLSITSNLGVVYIMIGAFLGANPAMDRLRQTLDTARPAPTVE